MIFIYIILSLLSVIHGIISAITVHNSKTYIKTPWYYEIYASLAVPLFPIIIFYIIIKWIIINIEYEYSTYKHRRTNR